ncbi:gonadoliberin III [Halovibrio salipaludis]|uniref:Gonadoliberin III n=1 Tax=Halovibrio salipaludis TaxID=2032626 RepID=A0A2A2F8B2_9GAMM|nr:inactive transglutaminase family protein [Halovibrio salipaludis]PAU80964.1 gonadoliberin III [Halovibrio salipaludis]
MRHQPLFFLAVSALIIIGVSMMWLRHDRLGIPLLPENNTPVWLVEARIDFVALGDETLASLSLPDDPPGYRIISEQAASPGYGFSRVTESTGHRGEWSKREATGPQTLYYKVQFAPGRNGAPRASGNTEAPSEPQRIIWEEPQATAAADLLETAQRRSSTPASLTRELIKAVQSPNDQNAALLLDQHSPQQLVVRLLNQSGVPARLAMGLKLEDARRNQRLQPLVDVYFEDSWHLYDLERGGQQGITPNTLVWHRTSGPVLDVMGGQNSQVRFSMMRQSIPALDLAQSQTSADQPLGYISLYQLPIEEQGMLKLLLLLPLGALVVAFMRIVIGIRTSGTFMPVLIALAFIQTTLLPGLTAFLTIVGLGLLLRGYLSRLNLLLVARIAAMIVLVVLLTGLLSVFGHEMGINLGMTITFFPMIIIAWTIERMSVIWEEQGAREVAIQGGGSLIVAIAAYGLMQLATVRHLTFNFPEVHLIILALILLVGQYTGYKLSELYRFRSMVERD